MRDDPEVRQLRDQVRNLEAQVAFSRGRGGGAAQGGCAVAGIVAGLAVVGALGAGSFLLLRPGGRTDQVQSDRASRESAERAQAECAARAAGFEAQVLELQERWASATTPTPPSSYSEDSAVYDARVTRTTGESHVHVGDTCRVDLSWSTDPGRYCRALVDCGARHVYGDVGQGWLPCHVSASEGLLNGEDDAPTSEDGDPRILVDRVTSVVAIGDDGPSWAIWLSIDAAPETH